jgi:ABC-type multidrug transport system ATPase subunit
LKSIVFENVSFTYKSGSKVFDNISFSLSNPKDDEGHVIALMGSSGSGKSTALKLMMRILTPQSGRVIPTPDDPVISYVPQEGVLFDHLDPMENARYFSRISAYKHSFDDRLFRQMSEILGMDRILANSKKVNELSGGQRQRLMLLRALSIRPEILLLDEPTTGLDAEVKLQLLHKLREIVMEQKLLAVYVSHHKIETELLVDEIAYLTNNDEGVGKVYQKDLASFVQAPPVMDAVRVFNYPRPNLLRCETNKDGFVHLCAGQRTAGYFFLNVNPESIRFSKETGFSYKVISRNPIYTVIELEGRQTLTFHTTKDFRPEDDKIFLSGKALWYDSDHQFVDFIQLDQNKII